MDEVKDRPLPRHKRFRGDRLRGLRKEAGYRQSDLADKCGVSRTQIVNYEGCNNAPSLEVLIALCDILEVSADYLLGISDYPGRFEDDYEDDEETEALESAAFGGHEDVYIEVEGHQQRVLGDPNMPEETKKALAHMIKAATEAIERGDFDDYMDN